jgi:ATP-dependent exoDNAse (exonuclease V) beta subunit
MQEMKDRIVLKLHEFSKGRLDDMAEQIMAELGTSKKEFITRSSDLLSGILHHYSHFAVTTIDAFFQQVLRSFSRELQLGGNYRLELDQDLVYQKVVETLLADLRKNKKVRKWILDFSMHKLDEGKGWEVDRELVSFLKELDKETFRKFDDYLWHVSDEKLHSLSSYTMQVTQSIEKRLVSQAEKADKLLHDFGLTEKDFKRGIHSYFKKILKGEFFKAAPGPTIMKALGEDDWHRKNHERAEQMEAVLNEGYRDCLAEVIQLYEEKNTEYKTAKAIHRNIYLFALSNALLTQLNSYKKDHDIMFVSDATMLLKGLIKDADAPFIYEKVGGFFNNFLIDEFQDTSVFQWASFYPLIENSLSEGHRCLIVGDVKQSIYRWRGGDLNLLHSEAEQSLGLFGVDTKQLDTNYRSAENIVQFNNAIFSSLPGFVEGMMADTTVSFPEIYKDVQQKIPTGRQNGDGYIELQFLPKEDFEDNALEKMLDVLKYLQDRNVALRDTAILVRRNSEAKRISDYLLNYRAANPNSPYSFEIVSSESLHLSTSPAVNCLVAAIRFVHQPKDALHAAAVKRFLYEIQETKSSSLEDYLSDYNIQELSHLSEDSDRYQRMPLYSLIESLVNLFNLKDMAGEIPYILTFQDQVLNYSRSGKGDIAGLLELWDEKLHKESIQVSGDLDAIRIMTIHKVKGLEFHSVIMPFVNWSISSNLGTEWFHFNLDEDEFVLPLNYTSSLSQTVFADDYHAEEAKRFLDHLNLLYVAFTRAAHDLWCICQEREGRQRVSNLLYDVLNKEELQGLNQSGNSHLFTFGSREFEYALQDKLSSDRERLPYYAYSDWQSRLSLKPAPKRRKGDDRQISISAGILIHDMLSAIRTIDEVDDVLANTKFTAGLDAERYQHLIDKIKLAFQNEEIRRWFDVHWEVRNEATIFADTEEYRPDRVIIDANEILVIDYKTGARQNSHIHQMKKYLSLLAGMYDRTVAGRILYLEDLEILEVK